MRCLDRQQNVLARFGAISPLSAAVVPVARREDECVPVRLAWRMAASDLRSSAGECAVSHVAQIPRRDAFAHVALRRWGQRSAVLVCAVGRDRSREHRVSSEELRHC
jgi:hypothetical protein